MIVIDHERCGDYHTVGVVGDWGSVEPLRIERRFDLRCSSCGQPDLCQAECIRHYRPGMLSWWEPVCMECTNWLSDIKERYAPGVDDES